MNQEFDKALQQQLRKSEEQLDAATLTRLREARQQAIAAAGESATSPWRANWIPAAAVATACFMAILVALSPDSGTKDEAMTQLVDAEKPAAADQPLPPLTEFEASLLLAADAEELLQSANPDADSQTSEELLDLYENLEFYEWLLLEDFEESSS